MGDVGRRFNGLVEIWNGNTWLLLKDGLGNSEKFFSDEKSAFNWVENQLKLGNEKILNSKRYDVIECSNKGIIGYTIDFE